MRELLPAEPFDPFRIKLVNGDAHDVSNPHNVATLEEGLYITSHDGEWTQFPYDRVASLESLLQF